MQGQLTTIRDNIQKRLAAQTGRPLGYAEESTDQSLGYADKAGRAAANPLYTKAPPPATAASAGLAVWSQLYGDYEQRSGIINGIDTGRITRTGGIVAGVDKVFTNVLGADALVVGLLTGDMASRVSNFDGSFSRITGPSIGYYSVWIFGGGFSTDSTFKVDFLNVNQTPPAGPAVGFGLTNYSSAYNINRKIDFTGWWVEPTAGVVYTRSVWNGAGHAIGLTDGNDFRVQAGSRFGTTFEWARASVDATLTALAYDDVSITGGTLVTAVGAGGPTVPTDQGKIFGQLISKLNFDWSKDIKGLSSYIESEIRGRSGVLGLAERIGVRYSW